MGLQPFHVGQRIELVSMVDDPDPIAPGTRGIIDWVNPVSEVYGEPAFFQLGVAWDNGRSLMVCVPPDVVRVLEPNEEGDDDEAS